MWQGSNIFGVVVFVVNTHPPQHSPALGGVGLPPLHGAQFTTAVVHALPLPAQVLGLQGTDLSVEPGTQMVVVVVVGGGFMQVVHC